MRSRSVARSCASTSGWPTVACRIDDSVDDARWRESSPFSCSTSSTRSRIARPAARSSSRASRVSPSPQRCKVAILSSSSLSVTPPAPSLLLPPGTARAFVRNLAATLPGHCPERCPSGLRSATGNRVRAERCVAGSNPALSVWRGGTHGSPAGPLLRRWCGRRFVGLPRGRAALRPITLAPFPASGGAGFPPSEGHDTWTLRSMPAALWPGTEQ